MDNRKDKITMDLDDIKIISGNDNITQDNINDDNFKENNIKIDEIVNDFHVSNIDNISDDLNVNNHKKHKRKLNKKTFLVITFILIVIFAFLLLIELFIFNNKNKFIRDTAKVYNTINELIGENYEDFSFLNSDYVDIYADSNFNYKDTDSKKYLLNYVEKNGEESVLDISDEKGKIINTKFKFLDIFNNEKELKHVFNITKRTIYKSLKIDNFKKTYGDKYYTINLKLNDSDIKRISKRVLQKIKLNKQSMSIIQKYVNLNIVDIEKNIDTIISNIDKEKFNDLLVKIYYENNKAVRYTINYSDYSILYDINKSNFIVEKNENKIIDVNIANNSISSNGNSEYNINYNLKDIDDKKIINFSLDTKQNKNLNLTFMYKFKTISDNEFGYDIYSSISSTFDNIDSLGFTSNVNIKNKE